MARVFRQPFPALQKRFEALGERLRLARLRRRISSAVFAQRMGVARDTLYRLEKGDANVALGTYGRALRVLGLDADIDLVAKDDSVGRRLQDSALRAPRRKRKRSGPTKAKP